MLQAAVKTGQGARRRTQKERSEGTRQKLVASAIDLLRQRRYAGLRTAEVAALAGVSKGAQSHHYPTKDALVLEALEETFRVALQDAQTRIAAADGVPGRLLELLVEDSETFFLGEDFLLSLDLMMVAPEDALGIEVKRLAMQYRFPVEKAWADALVAAGYARDAAQTTVALTYSVVRGLAIRQLMSGSSAGFAGLMAEWTAAARRMLGEPAAAQPSAAAAGRKPRH